MKNFSIILSTVSIILATVAIVKVFDTHAPATAPVATAGGAVSQADLVSVLTQNPKIVAEAMQAYERQQREAEEKAAAELLEKFAPQIMSEKNVPFVGPENAKVTITEFFDFSCGYCKRLSPEIEKIVADNPDVKVVFKPLTFVSPNSIYQAKAGFAAFNQGKFMEYYKGVMEGNAGSEQLVDEIAQAAGVDMERFKADVASNEVNEKLAAVSNFAQQIRVNGVPALFINGKQFNGRSASEIQDAINAAK